MQKTDCEKGRQLPPWLHWPARQLATWSKLTPRTKQLLAMWLLSGVQILFITVWNLSNSSHLSLVSIYPAHRCIQVVRRAHFLSML